MKFFDKILDKMNLSSDNEYEDDDDIIDEDDEVTSPRKFKKTTSDDIFEEKEEPKFKPVKKAANQPQSRSFGNNKVVSMRKAYNSSMEVCVFKPTNIEDGREISDTLLSGKAVVLNLEGLDVNLAQRIIDFTSGSCYAIRGNLQKISNFIFIITPETVDISGDFQELLGNDFSFPTGSDF